MENRRETEGRRRKRKINVQEGEDTNISIKGLHYKKGSIGYPQLGFKDDFLKISVGWQGGKKSLRFVKTHLKSRALLMHISIALFIYFIHFARTVPFQYRFFLQLIEIFLQENKFDATLESFSVKFSFCLSLCLTSEIGSHSQSLRDSPRASMTKETKRNANEPTLCRERLLHPHRL